MKQTGFKEINIRRWPKSELFSVPKALDYVQAVSVWNSVPNFLRPQAIAGLRIYFKNLLMRTKKIERKLIVRVIAGTK